MKLKRVILFLLSIAIVLTFAGCGEISGEKTEVQSVADETPFDKEDFEEYFGEFVQHFFTTVNNTDDLQNCDFFYFLFLQTYKNELHNNTLVNSQKAIVDKAVITDEQNVIIPQEFLSKTAERLFNIKSYDFSKYHSKEYFKNQLRPSDYYDEKTNSYCINIGSSFEGPFYFNEEDTNITVNNNIINVDTIIYYYVDLEVIEYMKKANYQFYLLKNDDDIYYQLKKIKVCDDKIIPAT